MTKYAKIVGTPAPQSEPLDTRQVKNSAGGYVYQLDDWQRLQRFLILGSDAPTYYQDAKALTRANAAVVERCWAADPSGTAEAIAHVSDAGRAPRNDAAIFALALGMVSANEAARKAAYDAMPKVVRIGTHLFQLIVTAQALGKGWGRGFKRAVARWYEARPADALAYQLIKYRQREGYDHARAIKTSHPAAAGEDAEARAALYRWAIGKEGGEALPRLVQAHIQAMTLKPGPELTALVTQHRLPWEAVPTEALKDPDLWAAMLPTMGLTALIRNLGAMTSRGTLKVFGPEVELVVSRLSSREEIRRARVHPYAILQALAIYRSGRGLKGSMTWAPIPAIIDALDQAFYMAFDTIEPSGKNILLALDVSGSMGDAMIGGVLSAREGAAALAMATIRSEPKTYTVSFSAASGRRTWSFRGEDTAIQPLPLSARMRLDEVVRLTSGLPFGATDCALPALYAAQEKLDVDAIVVLTDNETWAGKVHPKTALATLRKQLGKPVRQVVVGMTSTGFSMADPEDGLSLDVVGFDANAPGLISAFIRGDF